MRRRGAVLNGPRAETKVAQLRERENGMLGGRHSDQSVIRRRLSEKTTGIVVNPLTPRPGGFQAGGLREKTTNIVVNPRTLGARRLGSAGPLGHATDREEKVVSRGSRRVTSRSQLCSALAFSL